MRALLLALLLAISAGAQGTFTNPLLPSGPDPWIVREGNMYYMMTTPGFRLVVRKSPTLAGLKTATPVVVWMPPKDSAYSKQVWAPELHRIRGKWYIYFAADSGENADHRVYVVENSDPDPTTTTWNLRGKLSDKGDHWAIDLTAFEYKSKLYAAWAGWEAGRNGVQNIYIARLKNPWTMDGDRVLINKPELPWEKIGDLPNKVPNHVDVVEGPEFLEHDGHAFLIYSASGCWTDRYALGMMELKPGGDPMDPAAWSKSPQPMFRSNAEAHAFGPGHNGFFTSPDGKENWIVYHANPEPHQGCGNLRSPRAQPFTWNADGTPNFGKPLPLDQPIPAPSGERSPLQ